MLEPALSLESIAPARTGIAIHPFSSGERPRDFADSADQSVISVVRPPSLSSCRCANCRDFFVYVSSLYVARRSRRLRVDEGRYSYDAVELELMGVDARNMLGNAFRVLTAAPAKIAARWGVLERSAGLTLLEVVLEKGSELWGYLSERGD